MWLRRITDDPRGESTDFQAKITDAVKLAEDSSATSDVVASDKMAGKSTAEARGTTTTQQPGEMSRRPCRKDFGRPRTILPLRSPGSPFVPGPFAVPFMYRGKLTDAGTAVNDGNYDFQFALFDALSGGTQVGSTLTLSRVALADARFAVLLDFGANSFPGADRFLEIGVRPAGGRSFTTLSPRQQLTASGYGISRLGPSSPPDALPELWPNFCISGDGTQTPSSEWAPASPTRRAAATLTQAQA
jgi:hypothetical protein